MKIGGLDKCSIVDFPGRVAAVVFTQGCNFRCRYCHNPQLVYPHLYRQLLDAEYLMQFLHKRQGQLDGVVISGGEPTLQAGLIPFIIKLKQMGYLVKLDTNGSRPQVLRELIDNCLLDFIAMDIKSALANYGRVCGVTVNINDIKQSIRLIESGNIAYQFRTTYDTDLISEADLRQIADLIDKPQALVVQECLGNNKIAAL